MIQASKYSDENLRNVTIDIIERCNLACRLCYTESTPAKHHMMSYEQVINLLDRLRKTVDNVTITGGEALLHPDIEAIARHAGSHFKEVSILSNATNITDCELKWIAQLQIRLGVSIDGPEEIHDRQRGKGTFQKTANTLLRARSFGVPFWIQTVLGDFGASELEYMVRLGKALGAFGVSFQRPKLSGRINKRTTHWMSPTQYRETVKNVHALQAQFPEMSILIKDALFNCEDTELKEKTRIIDGDTVTGGCRAGLTYLYIKSNGEVLMCPFVPLSLGNAFRTDIYEIWQHGPELERIRTKSSYTTCSSCHNFRVCRGCRAEALAWSGDLMGEDPNCWRNVGPFQAQN